MKISCMCTFKARLFCLKGQPTRFLPLIFRELTPPKPLTRHLKAFQIWLRIREDVCNFSLTPHYRLYWRVDTLRIVYYGKL
jgi:hypothetical protein